MCVAKYASRVTSPSASSVYSEASRLIESMIPGCARSESRAARLSTVIMASSLPAARLVGFG
eukprot:2617807-Prymnesium_polylepis.1